MLQAGISPKVLQLARQHDAHAAPQHALHVVRVKERSLDSTIHVKDKDHGFGGVLDADILNDTGDGDVVTVLGTAEADVLVVADVVAWIVAEQLTARGVPEGALDC